jgi:hypothetical protein
MLRGGVDPALLDEVERWRSDDLWYCLLETLATYLRAAADRTAEPVDTVCRPIADEHGVTPTNAS